MAKHGQEGRYYDVSHYTIVGGHGHILCVMNGEPEQIESFLKDMDTYSIEQCWMDERVKTNDTSNGEHYGFWYNIVSTKPRKI